MTPSEFQQRFQPVTEVYWRWNKALQPAITAGRVKFWERLPAGASNRLVVLQFS